MPLGTALDVAIGLGLMFLLLSTIASTAQEIMAGIMKWRGTYLSKGLDIILDHLSSTDPKAQTFAFGGLWSWIKAHATPKAGITVGARYRAAATAANPANPVLQRVLDVPMHPLIGVDPNNPPSYVPAKNFSMAMVSVLRDGSQAPLFSQVETTIAALPDGDLKQVLTNFVQDAAGDVDKLRTHLEAWFDDAMDRVAGYYRRLSQYVMLALGMILAISLNVNTPQVATTLWTSQSERAALVADASDAVANAKPAEGDKTAADFQKQLADFESRQFPAGWSCWHPGISVSGAPPADGVAPVCHALTAADFGSGAFWLFLLASLPGWAMTAIAVSLGAPFWFDLLQKAVNMRSAGVRPKRADDTAAPAGV